MKEYWLDENRDDEFVQHRTGYPSDWEIEETRKKKLIKEIIKIIVNKIPLYKYYKLGMFVLSGEQHKWMYDKYGLRKLLEQSGFESIRVCGFNDSNIPGWTTYGLEINEDGTEYKPNNIYVEGIKSGYSVNRTSNVYSVKQKNSILAFACTENNMRKR